MLNVLYIRDLVSSGTAHTFEPFFLLNFSFFYCCWIKQNLPMVWELLIGPFNYHKICQCFINCVAVVCCSDRVIKADAKYINSQLFLHVPFLQAVCGAALGSREWGRSDVNGSTLCQHKQLRELGSAFGPAPQLQRELMSKSFFT